MPASRRKSKPKRGGKRRSFPLALCDHKPVIPKVEESNEASLLGFQPASSGCDQKPSIPEVEASNEAFPLGQPLSSESPGLIQAFFADYEPHFQHNPTASSSLEFNRLCDELGWNKVERQSAHQRFRDALVLQFNENYGTDVDSLENWRSLCYVVRIDPIPDDLNGCREAVKGRFVNLVDLVDMKRTGVEVELFETERELSKYTLSTRKIFPSEHAYAGGVLRYLLRHIMHPRDGGHSISRRRKGAKRRG